MRGLCRISRGHYAVWVQGPIDRALIELGRELARRAPVVYELHIDSPGGLVHCADEFVRTVQHLRCDSITIHGLCASAATLLLPLSRRISMYPSARIFVHEASILGLRAGEAKGFVSDSLKATNARIVKTYHYITGQHHEHLAGLMRRETSIDARRAQCAGWQTRPIRLGPGAVRGVTERACSPQVRARLGREVLDCMRSRGTVIASQNQDIEHVRWLLEG